MSFKQGTDPVTARPVIAVILAAGSGRRMGGRQPKQFARVAGRTVLSYTLEKFQTQPEVDAIVAVCPEARLEEVRRLGEHHGITKLKIVCAGGDDRRESSFRGVKAAAELAGDPDAIVLIHDAARPNVDGSTISNNIRLAAGCGACVTATPAVDTVVIADEAGFVSGQPDRRRVWNVQTPQSFILSLILHAHEAYEQRLRAGDNVPHITDDGGLVRFLEEPVAICAAGGDNFKLTVPDDLRRFRALVRKGGSQRGGSE
ncbi:MAG: 2-C-methyl-D-erythritol 4-phosphate cytidylyltransferase [Clostridia bacterium]|nr:2-C-methyl-D-erythritol 4-phosphate cytidylyltransferase [Clostridia bacterium]